MTNLGVGWLFFLLMMNVQFGDLEYRVEKISSTEVAILSDCRIEDGILGVNEKKANDTQNIDELHRTLEEVLKKISSSSQETSQIEILDLQYEYPVLIINISKEVTAYGGGNEAEYQVVCALLEWGFENTEAQVMEIYIEGSQFGFPEGSMTEPCTRESYNAYYQNEE